MTLINNDPCSEPYHLIHTPDYLGMPADSPFVISAAHMATIHNVLIRVLNSIVHQADGVEKHGSQKDVHDFLWYCRQWYIMLTHHHAYEERYWFGLIERLTRSTDIFQDSLLQHKAFQKGLAKYKGYVFHCYQNINDFSSSKLKSIIHYDLAPHLILHLHDEIDDLLRLEYDDRVNGEMMMMALKNCEFMSRGAASLTNHVPFAYGGANNEFEKGLHKFPNENLIVQMAVCGALWYAHSGSWRFLPSDSYGIPKQKLEF